MNFPLLLGLLFSLSPISSWAGDECDFVDLTPVSLPSPQYFYSDAGDLERRSLRPGETLRGPWIPLATFANQTKPDGSNQLVGFTAVNAVTKKKWFMKPSKIQIGPKTDSDGVKIDVVDLPDQLSDTAVFHMYKKKGEENYDQHELFELDGKTGKTKTRFYWKGGEYELGPMYVAGNVAIFIIGSDNLSPDRQIQLYSLKTGKMLNSAGFNFSDNEGYVYNEFIESQLINGDVILRFGWRGNPGNHPSRPTPDYVLTKDAIAASAADPSRPITLEKDLTGQNYKLSPDHVETTRNGYKLQEKNKLYWFRSPLGINLRDYPPALYLRDANLIATFLNDSGERPLLLGTCRPKFN